VPEDIWEASKYKIKAYVVDDSVPYTGKVDLYVLKDNDESNPIKTEKGISVKAGKPIERTFDVPKVDPKVATYVFSIVAKYGDGMAKSQQLADATVWPKEVKIHVKNKEDSDKDFKEVKLLVQQQGKDVAKPITDASGNCTVELSRKAPYTIGARLPYQILKNDPDASNIRKHEIQAVRRIIAMFVRPDVSASPPWVAATGTNNETNRKKAVRLWVNQKSKKKDAAEANGNVIEFEVSANPKSYGKKDDRIYIEVTFSRDSDRNDPKPELLNDPVVTDLANAPDPKVYKGYVKIEKDGGTAKFKVNTGLAGGDSCAVGIGGRDDHRDDEVRTFINWRKLFYELRYPALLKTKLSDKGDYADALKTAIGGKLGRAFVAFDKVKSHQFSDSKATFKAQNGMIMPKAFFNDGAGDIYVVTNGWLTTTNKFSEDADKRKQTVYVSLCERAFSSNVDENTVEPEIESDDFDIAEPADTYVFKKRTDDGEDNLKVEAGFKWKAQIAGAQMHATTWEAGAPSPGGAAPGKVTIKDTRRTGKSLTVSFDAKPGGFETTLSATEKTKVEDFIANLLSSDPELRDVGNQVTLAITAKAGGDDASRATEVLTVAKAKFDAVAKQVKYHPGLDRDGNPREGDMKVAWLSVKDYVTINVKLPKSAATVVSYKRTLPGDFVGPAETDTQCKVKVKYSYANGGEINGNSGGGSQIMVLRSAATADALSETVCHELGHSMGMAIVPGLANDLLPPGLATKHVDNGGTTYVNGDAPFPLNDGKRDLHKGGHCAQNIPDAKKAHVTFHDWSPDAGTVGCVMWGSGDNVATRTDFCDECLRIIKGRRLDDIKSRFADRGANDG